MVTTATEVAETVYDMICEGCPKEKECHDLDENGDLEDEDWGAVVRCMCSKLGVTTDHLNTISKHRRSQASSEHP